MDAALHGERCRCEVSATLFRAVLHPACASRASSQNLTFTLAERGVRAVLLDIEGTTTPVTFVHDVLFPYARARLRDFVDEPTAARMESLMDVDSKDGALKELQGRIWERGYLDGALTSVVYSDVREAFIRWRSAGVAVAIYSSGSVHAQRLLFSHSDQGDLTPHIVDYFDTAVGPKKNSGSYARIAAAMKMPPHAVLFVSDIVAELDAARDAGMQTLLAERPGNADAQPPDHSRIRTFAEITS